MARLFLIDVINNKVEEVEVDGCDINKFHELLHCSCFDIPQRKIGGKYYDIFCDDEGLLKEDQPPISAYSVDRDEPMLVGNLIIANHDIAGNTVSLSDDDIENIKQNLMFAISEARPTGYTLLHCEY